jgi:hypothetical protein
MTRSQEKETMDEERAALADELETEDQDETWIAEHPGGAVSAFEMCD